MTKIAILLYSNNSPFRFVATTRTSFDRKRKIGLILYRPQFIYHHLVVSITNKTVKFVMSLCKISRNYVKITRLIRCLFDCSLFLIKYNLLFAKYF